MIFKLSCKYCEKELIVVVVRMAKKNIRKFFIAAVLVSDSTRLYTNGSDQQLFPFKNYNSRQQTLFYFFAINTVKFQSTKSVKKNSDNWEYYCEKHAQLSRMAKIRLFPNSFLKFK